MFLELGYNTHLTHVEYGSVVIKQLCSSWTIQPSMEILSRRVGVDVAD